MDRLPQWKTFGSGQAETLQEVKHSEEYSGCSERRRIPCCRALVVAFIVLGKVYAPQETHIMYLWLLYATEWAENSDTGD